MITCKKCKERKAHFCKGMCMRCYKDASYERVKAKREKERKYGFSQLQLAPKGRRKKK